MGTVITPELLSQIQTKKFQNQMKKYAMKINFQKKKKSQNLKK